MMNDLHNSKKSTTFARLKELPIIKYYYENA